jgi:hypothetical protein
MAEFLFQVNGRVKERETGRFGRVKYCGTTGEVSGRFYDVAFDDGKTERVPESELLPAGPEPPGQG